MNLREWCDLPRTALCCLLSTLIIWILLAVALQSYWLQTSFYDEHGVRMDDQALDLSARILIVVTLVVVLLALSCYGVQLSCSRPRVVKRSYTPLPRYTDQQVNEFRGETRYNTVINNKRT